MYTLCRLSAQILLCNKAYFRGYLLINVLNHWANQDFRKDSALQISLYSVEELHVCTSNDLCQSRIKSNLFTVWNIGFFPLKSFTDTHINPCHVIINIKKIKNQRHTCTFFTFLVTIFQCFFCLFIYFIGGLHQSQENFSHMTTTNITVRGKSGKVQGNAQHCRWLAGLSTYSLGSFAR